MSKGKHRDEHKDNNITNSGEELGKKKIKLGREEPTFFFFEISSLKRDEGKL